VSADDATAHARAARHDLMVGERIRALRKSRKVSLAQLAAATGRSISYLSQIERGLSSPTVRELAMVAGVLRIRFLELLAEPADTDPDSPVRRYDDETMIPFRGEGVVKRVLAPRNHGLIGFYVMHIAAGGSSGEQPYTHDGEEAGYVLKGELSLTIDGRAFELRPGDSFRFASLRPHRFHNPGAADAEVLWINVDANGAAASE
jgi:transcriptional regulator with XRE-family HTH domain